MSALLRNNLGDQNLYQKIKPLLNINRYSKFPIIHFEAYWSPNWSAISIQKNACMLASFNYYNSLLIKIRIIKHVRKVLLTFSIDAYSKFLITHWNTGVGLSIGTRGSYFWIDPLSIKIVWSSFLYTKPVIRPTRPLRLTVAGSIIYNRFI